MSVLLGRPVLPRELLLHSEPAQLSAWQPALSAPNHLAAAPPPCCLLPPAVKPSKTKETLFVSLAHGPPLKVAESVLSSQRGVLAGQEAAAEASVGRGAPAPLLLSSAWCHQVVCAVASPAHRHPYQCQAPTSSRPAAAEASAAAGLDPHAVSVVIIKSLSTMRSPLIGSHVRSALLKAALQHGGRGSRDGAGMMMPHIWAALQQMPQPQGRVLQVRRLALAQSTEQPVCCVLGSCSTVCRVRHSVLRQ